MELDTDAAVSVITQRTYQKIVQQNHIQPLQQSELKLKTYSVDGEEPDLMGRDGLKELKVILGEIHALGDSCAATKAL